MTSRKSFWGDTFVTAEKHCCLNLSLKYDGVGDGTRTRMHKASDFKSDVSAIPPHRQIERKEP